MAQHGGKTNLNINVPVSLADKVAREAKRMHKSKTQVVREALEERYAPKEEPSRKNLDVAFYDGIEEEVTVRSKE